MSSVAAQVAALLEAASIRETPRSIVACNSGGNNRVYRVETGGGTFAAKHYFRSSADARDRLAAEFAFLTYAAKAAPRCVPVPHACDRELGWALYEFVHGRPFEQVERRDVAIAIAFFRALNEAGIRTQAASLPAASEACFSIREHLDLVRGRIGRLTEAATGSARPFLRALSDFWNELEAVTVEAARANDLAIETVLESAQRCLSPSDFGFHNALVESDGTIRFLDFEYAGWDDPAKTAGDFFAQLAVPVPQEHFDDFVREIMGSFPRSEELVLRARLLRPVYRVKWCCIALNVFHPEHLARRMFAGEAVDEEQLKEAQFAKAERLFESISEIMVNR